jgi:hypothetical protein
MTISQDGAVIVITTDSAPSVAIEQSPSVFIEQLSDGPQGVPGPGVPSGGTASQSLVKKTSSDYDTEWKSLSFNFTQSSPSSTWTINHNLGYKPNVDVYDSGSQQVQAEVSHSSVNQTVILFTVPTAGFARLT